ncbi:MAG: hypothetical protein J6J86_03570 [Lachnospiraceae bacterium]|nr:hypothetical protein [Lachnospiraceae bacterium]
MMKWMKGKQIWIMLLVGVWLFGLLPVTVKAETAIVWPAEGESVTVGSTEYIYKGDYSSTCLDLESSSFSSADCIVKAGMGYVLWNYQEKIATLHNASITAYSTLIVPVDTTVLLEGENNLAATTSYAINCTSGGITVAGTGSLMATKSSTGIFSYAINAGGGDISVDIDGDFLSGGISAQNGSLSIKSEGAVTITGLVRVGDSVDIDAGADIIVENSTNMAIWSINSSDITLTANNGDIEVSGGRNYSSQWYAFRTDSGIVTLEASGNVSVAGYDGYAGVNAGGLKLSGTIPENERLHSTCDVTVPEGKTLYNDGTLFINTGNMTVAGTLVVGETGSIEDSSGAIEPETSGSGSITSGPTRVATLDFRFEYNQPTEVKEYVITTGGTAKWEPGTNGAENILTLNGVTMSGDTYVVGVPENTKIVLIGENSITATDDYPVYAKDGVLNISGDGSLTVSLTGSNASGVALYGDSDVDIDILGELVINTASAEAVRSGEGSVSIESEKNITIMGSIYGSDSISVISGEALSIKNENSAAIFATNCDSVTLQAEDGDLTVKGTEHYAIYGNSFNTEITLAASGELSVSGNYGSSPYSIVGNMLNLSGTIPENTVLYTENSVTVPTGKVLTNNGTLQMYGRTDTIIVEGTLNNNGTIVNGVGIVTPEGSGDIEEDAYLDFTDNNTSSTGTGYSWDEATKTLTLTNFSMSEGNLIKAIVLPDGASVVLNGMNKLYSQRDAVVKAKGDLSISGTGTLRGTTGGKTALDAEGSVTITDSTVELTTTYQTPDSTTAVLCTNGHSLSLKGTADVKVTVKNYADTDAGFGINTGAGSVTISENASLTADAHVGILVKASTEPTDTLVTINGVLEVNCGVDGLCANLLGVKLDINGSSISMTKGSYIWLYQSDDTLTGETDVQAFQGYMQVATGNGEVIEYYKVTVDGQTGLYAVGSTVNFVAEVLEGSTFAGWKANGITLADTSSREISFIMPANEIVLNTLEECLVNVSAEPSEGGRTTGSGVYKEGDSVTVTATANNGYKFVKWMENGNEVYRNTTYTFTTVANCTLVAVFEEEKSSGSDGGDSEDDDTSVSSGKSQKPNMIAQRRMMR